MSLQDNSPFSGSGGITGVTPPVGLTGSAGAPGIIGVPAPGSVTGGGVITQYVPQPPAPSYKPVFQTGIQVLGPWGPQDINPSYCLTQSSADELAKIMAARVVLDFPFGHWPGGGGFAQLSLVPWLEFPSPDPDTPLVRINAGQLAWVFVRYPYDYALANVLGQVALAQRGM